MSSMGVSSKYGFASLDEKISINDNKQVVYTHPPEVEDIKSSYCWYASLFRYGMKYIDVFVVGVWLTDEYEPIFFQNVGDATVLAIKDTETILIRHEGVNKTIRMLPDAPRAVIFGHNPNGTSEWRFW